MKCIYCKQNFIYSLSIQEIFKITFNAPPKLCPTCQNLFVKIDKYNCCQKCKKSSKDKLCADCKYWQKIYPNYDFNHDALYKYNEEMHNWFSLYKFKGHKNLSVCFANEIQNNFKIYKNKFIVPIPLSRNKLNERGFNQVEELLKKANINYYPILKKKKNYDSTPQSSKPKNQRLKTTQPFFIPKKYYERCTKKEILIVDDIYTTGRTLFHAAECFKNIDIKKIETFSLAR